MPLRLKVLGLFLLLGVLPLIGLGVVEYVRSLRAVESLLVAQNAQLAERVALIIEGRTRRMESDLLLLAENAESQRWLRSNPGDISATLALRQFLDDAWPQLRTNYRDLHITDVRGRTLSLTSDFDVGAAATSSTLAPIVRPIRDDADGRAIGTLQVSPRAATVLGANELIEGFGEHGLGMVVDHGSGAVVFDGVPQVAPREAEQVFGSAFQLGTLREPSGALRFVAGDTTYIAAFRRIEGAAWTVVMAAALPEFSAPFASVGRSTLITFTAVALLAAVLFSGLIGRTTRSLEELTAAAAVVGQGNFAPTLPRPTSDEVGRLGAAFGTMVTRVRDMVEEVRANRQMAVLGEFAAQLSHEVRNPLTSIKLNQQRIQRFLDERDAPPDIRQSLTIALREVDRLDHVVRGVLQLARATTAERVPRSIDAVVRETVELIADQAAAQHVQVELVSTHDGVRIAADAGRLKGALLNLLINALEAMPTGGVLRVTASVSGNTWQLEVHDTGPGIPDDRRGSVFMPFDTSKASGTGLGLPLARRAIEEHGGTLSLAPYQVSGGATFVVTLPVAHA